LEQEGERLTGEGRGVERPEQAAKVDRGQWRSIGFLERSCVEDDADAGHHLRRLPGIGSPESRPDGLGHPPLPADGPSAAAGAPAGLSWTEAASGASVISS